MVPSSETSSVKILSLLSHFKSRVLKGICVNPNRSPIPTVVPRPKNQGEETDPTVLYREVLTTQ